MTRGDATSILQKLIDSEIISDEIREELQEICRCLCDLDFESCDTSDNITSYCHECRHYRGSDDF